LEFIFPPPAPYKGIKLSSHETSVRLRTLSKSRRSEREKKVRRSKQYQLTTKGFVLKSGTRATRVLNIAAAPPKQGKGKATVRIGIRRAVRHVGTDFRQEARFRIGRDRCVTVILSRGRIYHRGGDFHVSRILEKAKVNQARGVRPQQA
jgi:hypothetical protein